MNALSPDLLRAVENLPSPRILVVGDFILDRYVRGGVERVSPEAPIQVLRQEEVAQGAGGMGAVVRNLVRLGARVRAVAVVGDDDEGVQAKEELAVGGTDLSGVLTDPGRPTTLKTRFSAASHSARQQILRVDRESTAPVDAGMAERLVAAVHTGLGDADLVVLSDYAKGVLQGDVCRSVIAEAAERGIPCIADPKGIDFDKYRGATALTPNRPEAGAATGRSVRSLEDAAAAARSLLESLELASVYITLDRDGIYVRERDGEGCAVPTDPREVYDVTGAGDNVIAVLAHALAGGLSPVVAATLANVAGGLAVERRGVVTVGWDQIVTRIAAALGGNAKLRTASAAERLVADARRAGRKVVFTNGCFDVLHAGHVDFLRRAGDLGDLLIVAINDDGSIRRLKGEGRPVNGLEARASVLGGLAAVDCVVAFGDDTPEALIRRLRPDVLVKGEDWADKGVVGREFVEEAGGQVVLLPLIPGLSTTSILRKLSE